MFACHFVFFVLIVIPVLQLHVILMSAQMTKLYISVTFTLSEQTPYIMFPLRHHHTISQTTRINRENNLRQSRLLQKQTTVLGNRLPGGRTQSCVV